MADIEIDMPELMIPVAELPDSLLHTDCWSAASATVW